MTIFLYLIDGGDVKVPERVVVTIKSNFDLGKFTQVLQNMSMSASIFLVISKTIRILRRAVSNVTFRMMQRNAFGFLFLASL